MNQNPREYLFQCYICHVPCISLDPLPELEENQALVCDTCSEMVQTYDNLNIIGEHIGEV